MTNEEIIQKLNKIETKLFKADSDVSDGLLNPAQSLQFILETVDTSEFLKKIGLVKMTRDKQEINTLGLDSRLLRAGEVGTAPDATDFSTGLKKRQLTAIETVLAVDVPFTFIEENIEEENIEATLTKVLTTQFGNDLVDLIINGDEGSQDPFLSINNGYAQIALTDSKTHKDTFTSDDKIMDVLDSLLSKLPDKWKIDVSKLAFFLSPSNNQTYKKEVGARFTIGGDQALLSAVTSNYQGIEIAPIPTFPNGLIMLTNPINLKIGWHKRYLRLGRFINERKRQIEYTFTSKLDAEYAISDQVAIATNGIVPAEGGGELGMKKGAATKDANVKATDKATDKATK
jgi:hypothetical protein